MYTLNQDVYGEKIEAVSVSQINLSVPHNTSDIEVACPELVDEMPLVPSTRERRQA